MPWAVAAAGVAAAGSLAGASIGSSAQQKASGEASNADLQGLDFQQGVYNNTVNNLAPFLNTGTSALSSLAGLYGLNGNTQGATDAYNDYTKTPAYQFALQQGNLSANRGLAASGLTGSGAQAKALEQYGQGYASTGFNGYVNQLASLAGMGQNAASLQGSQGNTASGNALSALIGSGNALASGAVGSAATTNSGITGAAGALGGLTNNTTFQNYLSGIGKTSFGNTSLPDMTSSTPGVSTLFSPTTGWGS